MNDTATTEIYTLSLRDALPIWPGCYEPEVGARVAGWSPSSRTPWNHPVLAKRARRGQKMIRRFIVGRHGILSRIRLSDRKSTRLNSSHANISYAVFCLK